MKKIITLFLIMLLASQTTFTPASAQGIQDVQTEYFDDGSYLVTSITEQPTSPSETAPFSLTDKSKPKTASVLTHLFSVK